VEPLEDAREPDDDRPPICPACGVTMGIVLDGRETGYRCLECGFANEERTVTGGEYEADRM